ncbi:AAA family ATPase [Thioclava sp.]|uniref:AAA family ATPase n=1 Tax=Thioclava sp. TaxID=1933450 RepID=UPI003AA91DAB
MLPLSPGLTALLGKNDAGKTAVLDALRFICGTRAEEYCPVQDSGHVSEVPQLVKSKSRMSA